MTTDMKTIREAWKTVTDFLTIHGADKIPEVTAHATVIKNALNRIEQTPVAAIPPGWKLMPDKTTTLMDDAGVAADDLRTGYETVKHIYAAMYEAAPPSPIAEPVQKMEG